MKKIYLLGLLAAGLSAVAQVPQNRGANLPARAITVKKQPTQDVPASVVVNNNKPSASKAKKADIYTKNDIVGKTFIVNQTNLSPYRRILAYPDGKISLTWTASTDNASNGFLARGSGYNHFNGTQWITVNNTANANRIEPYRAGFPAMVGAPDNSEIIISHRVDTSGRSGGLVLNRNTGIGNTTWTSNAIFTPPANTTSQLWPRAVVTGDNMIVLASYQDSSANQPNYVVKSGVRAPLVYSRYNFTSNTWTEQDLTLPGYDSTLLKEGSSDNYSIDANGNHVAVLLGGVFNSLVLWKSDDNGSTWNRTILDSFPADFVFDQDSLTSRTVNNGSVNVTVDANGKAHVFSGMARVSDSIMNDGSYTFSWSRVIGGVNDGILYWNEYTPDSGLRIIATAVGPTLTDSAIGDASFETANRYGISNSTWPSAGIDAQGRIYLTYSALTPTDVSGQNFNYRDLFLTYSADNGATWSYPTNLTSWISFNREEAYPNMAKNITNDVHISYLNKINPGSTVTDNSEMFDVYYLGVPVSQIMNEKVGVAERANDLFSIEQNFPNPFHGTTSVPVKLNRATDVTITVANIVGQNVYTNTFKNNAAGVNNFNIELNNVKAGVYFYTVQAGDFKVTRKMIVE